MAAISVIVKNRVPEASALMLRRIDLATRKAAFDIEGQAKQRAPVRTGNLRNSINANGRGSDWRVDSPAEYSIYQEFGTRYMPAHPYMVPAAEYVRPSYLAALKMVAG